MIISHQYKFIFIKCRKTAGTSMEIALSQFCTKGDIITPISQEDEKQRRKLNFPGPQNYLVPAHYYKPKDWARLVLKQRRKYFYNHMPAYEIQSYVSSRVWNTYFKFCFERNPFDKILSHYYWAGGPETFGSIKGYLDQKAYNELNGFNMYSFNGELIVDKIFAFENFPDAFAELKGKLKLPYEIQFPKYHAKSHTRTDRRPYQQVISSDEQKRIELLFSKELTYFGYTF